MENFTVKELVQILNEYIDKGFGDYPVVAAFGIELACNRVTDVQVRDAYEDVKLVLH